MKDHLLKFGHFLHFTDSYFQFWHVLSARYAKGIVLHRIYFSYIFLRVREEIFADVRQSPLSKATWIPNKITLNMTNQSGKKAKFLLYSFTMLLLLLLSL